MHKVVLQTCSHGFLIGRVARLAAVLATELVEALVADLIGDRRNRQLSAAEQALSLDQADALLILAGVSSA